MENGSRTGVYTKEAHQLTFWNTARWSLNRWISACCVRIAALFSLITSSFSLLLSSFCLHSASLAANCYRISHTEVHTVPRGGCTQVTCQNQLTWFTHTLHMSSPPISKPQGHRGGNTRLADSQPMYCISGACVYTHSDTHLVALQYYV